MSETPMAAEKTYEEAWANEAELRDRVPNNSKWRHLKRGTEYEVFDLALMQDATGTLDMVIVVVYWSYARSSFCVRPIKEFLDGRFERFA